ncbi:hypothetical protein BGZ61DRAFT_539858 [Ilyonectria robusta]|uniref:uncharacterized protein n=1 Tax=Ilyonectria robusta TaxID=1079257 RepID=UPI001E8ED6CB|nr:uncharacterized protein BGZ61DRAFT_539858 [Ilyonectria robusta]KAH8661189.1 hypothetical protein BGZ61DRAFT_539858 [Ilyonectria robusta]
MTSSSLSSWLDSGELGVDRGGGKKLKLRLEDLERRAGSSDDVESDKQPQETTKSKRSPSSSKSRKSQPTTPAKPVTSHGQFTPPMEPTDALFPLGTYADRACSGRPSKFICSTYPAPDGIPLTPYGSAQPYPIMTTADAYPNYLAASTVPMTLPSMTHFSDAIKWESYPADDRLTPYMTYGYMSPMDFNAPSPYDQPNPHTPNSSDYSANCSEAGYEYSIVPLSMPNSPDPIRPPREIKDYICDSHLNPAKTTTTTKSWYAQEHEHGPRHSMEYGQVSGRERRLL